MTEPIQVGPAPITIKSDAGVDVEYQFYPWPLDHGIAIGRRLIPLLQGALGGVPDILRGVQGALPQLAALKDAEQAAQLTGLAQFAGEFSAPISDVLGALAGTLRDAGDGELFLDLLTNAVRRTKGQGDGVTLGHAKRADFNAIYAANYGELLVACAHALVANFGPAWSRLKKDPGVGAGQASTPTRSDAQRKRHR